MAGEQSCKKGLGDALWQQLHRSQQSHEGKPLGRENTDGQKMGIPWCTEVVLECCVCFWTPQSEKDVQGHEHGWSSTGTTSLCLEEPFWRGAYPSKPVSGLGTFGQWP